MDEIISFDNERCLASIRDSAYRTIYGIDKLVYRSYDYPRCTLLQKKIEILYFHAEAWIKWHCNEFN